MTFKTFLTFHALEQPISKLNPIIELARTADAHLDIIVLGVLNTPPVVIHDIAPAAKWVTHNNNIIKEAEKCAKDIEKLVAQAGISASVTIECDYLGMLDNTAARYTLCADLYTVTKDTLETDKSVEKAVNQSLFEAGCPFLLLPNKVYDFKNMTKIAIAWNGLPQAAQAIHRALPLLKNAESVNIIVVDPFESYVGQDPGSDIAAFLARYGIKVTVDVLASGGKTAPQKLLQRVKDIDADVLVMGAYGRTKLSEWLLGGATKEMLKIADVPVFMCH